MGRARVELPDGRKAVVEFDTQGQLEAAIKDLTQPEGSISGGWGEAALQLGSSAIATPVAGLAGGATAIAKGLGLTNTDPAEVVRNTQQAFTYQPRTQTGEIASSIVAWPFEKIAQGADWVGNKVLDKTDSPALATGVNAAIQLAPSLLLKARGKAAPAAASQATAEASARAFVTNTVGVDWGALPRQVQAQLTEVAKDARNLHSLNPDAIRRQANLASLDVPVPATRGQITRDPVQMRNEANVAGTQQGGPIREVYDAQNRALIQNLDVLRGRVRGTARTAEDAGRSVQDAGLRAKAARAKSEVDRQYATARRTEPDAAVSAQPLYELLDGSPEVTRLGWMESWLNRAKVTKRETGPDGTQVDTQRPVTARELDDLRQRAVKIARAGGTDSVYAGDVIRAIDSAMEDVPASALAWRKARDSYKAMKREFSDQGAVADLVENFPNSADRRVALERTVNRIATGSIEDIRTVKRSLLTGGDSATRTAGRQAWRDVRAQVIQQIRDEATKNVSTLADGTPNLSVAALKRAVDKIGNQRIDEIFGAGMSRRLNAVVKAAQEVKTIPAQSVPVGSTTLQNMLALLGNSIEKIPGIGGPIGDVARAVTAPVRNAGQARSAVADPLAESAQQSRNALARRRAGQNALAAGPATAPRDTRR